MKEHILALMNAGHDISFNADVNLFCYENSYQVEIFDPRDDETGEPFHNTFVGYKGLMNFHRFSDIWHKQFTNPEEAVDLYLDVCQWLTRKI